MDIVESTVWRSRMLVSALAAGVLVLTAVTGLVDLEPSPFAVRGSFPVGLAGLIALVVGWRGYIGMRSTTSNVDVETACARSRVSLLAALAITAQVVGWLAIAWG